MENNRINNKNQCYTYAFLYIYVSRKRYGRVQKYCSAANADPEGICDPYANHCMGEYVCTKTKARHRKGFGRPGGKRGNRQIAGSGFGRPGDRKDNRRAIGQVSKRSRREGGNDQVVGPDFGRPVNREGERRAVGNGAGRPGRKRGNRGRGGTQPSRDRGRFRRLRPQRRRRRRNLGQDDTDKESNYNEEYQDASDIDVRKRY